MTDFTPWTKDEYIKRLQEDGRVFIAQRLEVCRENDRLKARIEVLEDALGSLSHIHDRNPSDAYASVPELDYARHMLWEARQIARKALEGKDD
jgi:hypothetical protein